MYKAAMSMGSTGMPPPHAGQGGFVSAPPRWSAVAITGFVLSFLFVLAPIGILLGIAGIFATRGQRRKGMGLAIAAIPIGIGMSAFSALVIFATIMAAAIMGAGPKATAFMKVSRTDVSASAQDVYAHLSHQFRDLVPAEEFQAWATSIVTQHGTLQSSEPTGNYMEPAGDGGYILNLKGNFTNGPAQVRIKVGVDGFAPQINDIEVDGVSAIASAGK